MTNTPQARLKNTRLKTLGEVEQLVMDYLWTHGPSSSEACREALAPSRPMKDSTIRTVLRRLEEKGYLTHETEGRTFVYRASDARQNVAVRAVKSIIDRFCGGSAEQLVLGMVDNAVLNGKQLERLARKIAEKQTPESKFAENNFSEKTTAVLYSALAIPLLGWVLPSLPVPTPSFVQSVFQNVRQNRIFVAIAEQASAKDGSSLQAAERRKNAAHGASRGTAPKTDKPQWDERPALALTLTPAATEAHASPSSLPSEPATTNAPTGTVATSPSPPASIPWSAVAAGTYLVAALFLLARFCVGLAFSRRLLKASQIIDDARLTTRLASQTRVAGMAFVPSAAESEFISVPVTMGALRSTILLPAAWREWDDAKLDAVVAHELSHIARHDALTQRLSLLHRAIFCFSPLAWWLDRHLANLAEQASDEAALSCGADRKHYATTLLEFFEALQAAPGRVWWQGVSMAKAGQAEERVERILSWKGTVTRSEEH